MLLIIFIISKKNVSYSLDLKIEYMVSLKNGVNCSHRAQHLADILSSKGLPAACISGERAFWKNSDVYVECSIDMINQSTENLY